MINTYVYPCDRGIPNNVLGRGYHNFQIALDGTNRSVCTYCGQIAVQTHQAPHTDN